MQGPGGPLANFGVERFVADIERRRELVEQIRVISGTEYIGLLEKIIGLIYDKIYPNQDRG